MTNICIFFFSFQSSLESIHLLRSVTSTPSCIENVQIMQSYEILDFDAVSVTAEYFYITIAKS